MVKCAGVGERDGVGVCASLLLSVLRVFGGSQHEHEPLGSHRDMQQYFLGHFKTLRERKRKFLKVFKFV